MFRQIILIPLLTLLLCFHVLPSVEAQQKNLGPIAPLISEKTLAVAQFDLKAVDFEQLRKLALFGTEQSLKLNGFDQESLDDILNESNILLDAKLPMFEDMYKQFLKDTGLKSVYFIAYYDLFEKQCPGFLVFPLQGTTPSQQQKLLEILEENDMPVLSVFRNYYLVPAADAFVIDQEEMKQYFSKLKPKKIPAFDEAFQGTESALMRAAVVVPENLIKTLTDAGMPPIPLPQVGNLLQLLNDETKWARLYISLDPLDLQAQIQMSSEETAREVRETLAELIDVGVGLGMMMSQQQEEMAEFLPLMGAFFRGSLKTLLPVVDGDQLVYNLSDENVNAAALGVGGVAVALLLPAVQAAREAARRMQCVNHMKQLGLGMHNYHDVNRTFPPAYTVDENGKPLHSWRVLLLPYLEQTALYEQIRLDEPWDSEYNSQFHHLVVPTFQCPSNRGATPDANCCYSIVIGKDTVFPGSKGIGMGDIMDGTSNTIMIVEREEPVCWMDPTSELTLEDVQEYGKVGSSHTGGFNVVFCDGSVLFLPNTISTEALENLLNCNDGKFVDFSEF